MMSKTADVVVIGGGMQGTCAAYYLAKAGQKVILVERGDLASGTTSRSDGDSFINDVPPGYMTEFAEATIKEFIKMDKEIDCDFEWVHRGCVLLMETEEEVEFAKELAKAKQATGSQVRFMDQKEVHDDEPNTAPDIPGGLEFTAGGALNPMQLAYGLGREIEKCGGELMRFTEVTGFEKNADGRVCKVITNEGEIITDNVVIACGIWSQSIAEKAGVYLPIHIMKGDLLVIERDAYITRRKTMEFGYNLVRNENHSYKRKVSPFMEKYGIGFLFEPTNSTNGLVGFSKYAATDTVSNNLVTRAIAKRAIRFFPKFADVSVIHCYAGLRPQSPDGEPIVSRTNVPGVFVSAGHGGNGIMFAPISGKLISQMVCGQKTDMEMGPLSLDRFQRVEPSVTR
ncbi:FAD-binding oxidoreductase [Clostridium sp. KNHs216]|uniref:NAD(P)/FAD-dependent oxidoreductase n=1 Tax=Clostridium sp. KNHs216 TaxID=1550235 RepID=UPI00114EC867|nr:FAD-binding oxidoreductase [Clostridium sp. KNHs216]TQI66981.1 sarcosine oxidase subunit beta [Clostridium sp. KNHs216]